MIAGIRNILVEALLAAALFRATPLVAEVLPWPPRDPDEETARVEITLKLASDLRDDARFDDVQRRFGAEGRLVSVSSDGDAPRAVYHWTGEGGRGEVTAFLYQSGDFGLTITPADGRTIRMNNFGAFFCPDCTPPVAACGRHPSWVPHWIHWDNFDCPCTVTGPHTEGVCEGH